MYRELSKTIHDKGWKFFIFYSKLEDYNLEPRQFMTAQLKYADITVGERVLIGIVMDTSETKRNLYLSFKKVRAFYGVHVISEF